MAARDRYKYHVRCPNCGEDGVFHISEDDHPYMRKPHRSVDQIEGEFTATVKDGVDVTATCKTCGAVFTA